MRNREPSERVTAVVDERDNWSCVRCGVSLYATGGSRHHRQLRSQQPNPRLLNRPSNLILLCGSGSTGCHGWVHAHPAEAYELGWLVHGWDDPSLVPVRYRIGDRFHMLLLDDEGGKEEA